VSVNKRAACAGVCWHVNWICQSPDIKKVRRASACYSAAYMSQTRVQKSFTFSELAADWHELMTPQHIMQPSIARAGKYLDLWCSMQTYHHPTWPSPLQLVRYYRYSFPVPLRVGGWVDLSTQKLAQCCLQMTRVRFEPQPESYESDAVPLDHLHIWQFSTWNFTSNLFITTFLLTYCIVCKQKQTIFWGYSPMTTLLQVFY